MQELETISEMVLDMQMKRPMLIIAWGRFLKMFEECYPESRPTQRAADFAETCRQIGHWWVNGVCVQCGSYNPQSG